MHGAERIVVTEFRQALEGRLAVLDVDELEAERLRDRRSRIGPVDQLLQEGEPVGRERLILRRDAVFPHHLVHAALPLFAGRRKKHDRSFLSRVSGYCWSMIFFRKPVSTFRDHALIVTTAPLSSCAVSLFHSRRNP